LSGQRAFARVFEQGKRREGRFLQIVFAPAETSELGRVGFIVSRKVMPLAVDRNRFKRKVRVGVRALRAALVRYDIIVRVKNKLVRADIGAAAMEAETQLTRIAAQES
jgi:ribonuclease P protein component